MSTPIKGKWINAETGEIGLPPKLYNEIVNRRYQKKYHHKIIPYIDILSERAFNNAYMEAMNVTDLVVDPTDENFEALFDNALYEAKQKKFISKSKGL